MLRQLSYWLCLLLFCLFGAVYAGINTALLVSLSLIVTGAVTTFLGKALLLTRQIAEEFKINCWSIQSYIVLHLVPAVYWTFYLFNFRPNWTVAVWLVPMLVFFYMGRRAWRTLFSLYRSKLYRLFIRGHSAMLLMLSIASTITILSFLFDRPLQWHYNGTALSIAMTVRLSMPALFVERLLGFYFAVHFLLIGVAVLKIDNDVNVNR